MTFVSTEEIAPLSESDLKPGMLIELIPTERLALVIEPIAPGSPELAFLKEDGGIEMGYFPGDAVCAIDLGQWTIEIDTQSIRRHLSRDIAGSGALLLSKSGEQGYKSVLLLESNTGSIHEFDFDGKIANRQSYPFACKGWRIFLRNDETGRPRYDRPPSSGPV